jgi:FkbM family methyltransferase
MNSLKNEMKIIATIIRNYFREMRAEESNKKKKALDFYAKIIPEGALVFDVGANIGNRVALFLKLKGKVVAFEPQSYCAKHLRIRYGNKINLEEIALGEVPGTGEIQISNSSTISSMSTNWIDKVKNGRFQTFVWNNKETIKIDTLDNMIKKYGIPIFCKIDVEGYEPEVLKGLNQKIKCLSFEYAIPESIDNTIECIKKLSTLGSIECNYSNGESFVYAYKEWVNPDILINQIKTEFEKNNTEGDIYIKYID